MSKHDKKHSKRRPPRFRRVYVGQIWHVQKSPGAPVITGHIDEVSAETIFMRWLADGSLTVKPDALVVRYARRDLTFLELVAQPEKVAA